MKYFIHLILLMAMLPSLALGARTVTADQIKNGLQTQTYTVPTATGTLITTAQERTSNYGLIGEILTNPDFEASTYSTGWSVSAGTLAAAAGTNILFGSKSATWDSSAASQTFCSDAIAIPQGYYGQNGEASFNIQTPSGTATHLMSVFNGATQLSPTKTVNSTTTASPSTINFVYPTSGNIQICLTSVASDEPLIAIDDAHLGKPRNVGSTQLVGEWTAVTMTTNWGGTAAVSAFEKRVGDVAQYYVEITPNGAVTAANLTVTLPTGRTINTAKIPSTNGSQVLGVATTLDAGTTDYTVSKVVYGSTTSVLAYYQASGSNAAGPISNTAPFTYGNLDKVWLRFEVPIVGWTSQTLITADQQRTPTVQVLTSGTTYTTPAGVTYLEVELVGGGGGGGASGTTAGGGATSGGTTSFGTSLLSATGGGNGGQQAQPAGGVPTITSPAIEIVKANGNSTGSGSYTRSAQDLAGSAGGASPFGGAGAGGAPQGATAGGAAIANSGSGGGGAGFVNVNAGYTGVGGASGGYLKAIIVAPSASYTYAIGAGGSGSTAGTSGAAGGAGAAGKIIVKEFYGYTTALLANSVSTSNTNGEKIESLRVDATCTATPCTIASQSGAFTSVTRSGTGTYSANYPSTTWTAAPRCVVSAGDANTLANCKINSTATTTAVGIFCPNTSTAAGLDSDFNLICMGPR